MNNEPKGFSVREYAVIITLALNIAGMIWSAATINAHVESLTSSVNQMSATMSTVITQISDIRIEYNARIAVLEADRVRNSTKKGR